MPSCLYHKVDSIWNQHQPANNQRQSQANRKAECCEDNTVGADDDHAYGFG